MASFLKQLKEQKDEVISTFYNKITQAEETREMENQAAICIQTNFRMYLILTKYKTIQRAVRTIKRIWKGFKIRVMFLKTMRKEKERMHFSFYCSMAAVIQRMFRGYYVRKYKHDFYARKKYLFNVSVKNKEIRDNLEEFKNISEIEEQKRREEIARMELTKVASNVHHLCSTKAIPGVFNSPYISDDMKPQIFNVDVETHLKTTFKSNYQWKAPNREKINYFKQIAINN